MGTKFSKESITFAVQFLAQLPVFMCIKDKLSRFIRSFHFYPAVLLLLILTGSYQASAQAPRSRVDQLSDEDVQNFYRRAEASGLNEMQIEQAAMSQGYTLDDIAKMRKRIASIRTKTTRPSGQTATDNNNRPNTAFRSLPPDRLTTQYCSQRYEP